MSTAILLDATGLPPTRARMLHKAELIEKMAYDYCRMLQRDLETHSLSNSHLWSAERLVSTIKTGLDCYRWAGKSN